jgi:hypothetical protein
MSEVGDLYVFQLGVKALPGTGEEGDIMQPALALIPQSRSPDSRNVQEATYLLYDESSQCCAFNILCDYEQRLTGLCDLIK